MIDLSNATFITAVKIDSPSRLFNFHYTIQYLCRNLITNIIIVESDSQQRAKFILNKINPIHSKITYIFEKCEDGILHRTKLLNIALAECKTDCVVNYDIDVIMDSNDYLKAYNSIINDGNDLVYPYFEGMSQKQVFLPGINDDLTKEISVRHVLAPSVCGHCCFLNRKSYMEAGMENEGLISWSPDDSERLHRFKTLGYKVVYLDGFIFHLEHERFVNSGKDNPHYDNNEALFNQLKSLSPEALREYYTNPPYLKKYKKKMIILLTYADENYSRQQEKLVERALELDTVDFYITMNRSDIIKTDFYQQNKTLLDEPRGSGYWVWKSYLILEALKTMEPDDILVYLDSGDWISRSFRTFVQRTMRTKDILLTEGGYPNIEYTKYDVFKEMGCLDKKFTWATQVEAGIIVCKNTPATVKIFTEWLNWCLKPGIVDDSPSEERFIDFVDHRHDQSVLSLLQVLHDIPATQEMRTYINCNQNTKD